MKTKAKYYILLACFISSCTYTMAVNPNKKEAPVIIPKGYTKLVFQDEFTGKGLIDNSKWNYEEGYLRNKELQYYTRERLENCYQKNGFLYIVAKKDSARINGEVRPITSASITTKGKGDWKYCRVEVRAKLPICLGTWPAIWMMPKESTYGRWPASGEIDIMEHVGYEPETIHYAIHTDSLNHIKNNGIGSKAFCIDAQEWHVYALEWHEDRIEWYLDGRKRFESKRPQNSSWRCWPFDKEFYLILNLAFGGGWGGSKGVDTEGMPLEYVIDYVRVFQ